MTEKQIQNAIILKFGAVSYMRIWRVNVGLAYAFHEIQMLFKLIRSRDIYGALNLIKTLQPIRFLKPGHADICGILKGGRFIAIEVKSEKGKQSKVQEHWQAMIELFGGLYILARGVEDVEIKLREAGII